MRSIDDTSNFDDFPDVEIGFGELGREKKWEKVSSILDSIIIAIIIIIIIMIIIVIIYTYILIGVESQASQEEAKESKAKDWMFINYTFKRFLCQLWYSNHDNVGGDVDNGDLKWNWHNFINHGFTLIAFVVKQKYLQIFITSLIGRKELK